MRLLNALLLSLVVFPCSLPAAIVLSHSSTQTLAPDLSSATVTVQIFGASNAADSIGFYAFDVQLSSASSSFTLNAASASYVATSVGPWGNINTLTSTPQVNVATNTISFKGGGRKAGALIDPFNQLIGNAPSLIGSFTFTTSINANDFRVRSILRDTIRTAPADTTGTLNSVEGFAFADTANTGTAVQGIPFDQTITVSGITAVPEPSSLLLLGLAGAGIAGHRVRKIRKAKHS